MHYGHDAGIAYLLTVLPQVCEGELPRKIFLIGIEIPFSPATIARAAHLALLMVKNPGSEKKLRLQSPD